MFTDSALLGTSRLGPTAHCSVVVALGRQRIASVCSCVSVRPIAWRLLGCVAAMRLAGRTPFSNTGSPLAGGKKQAPGEGPPGPRLRKSIGVRALNPSEPEPGGFPQVTTLKA